MGIGFISFDRNGHPKEVSRCITDQLKIPNDQLHKIAYIIPEKFFQDIFHDPGNIFEKGSFHDYRIWMTSYDGIQDYLFHISGVLSEEGLVESVWKPIHMAELNRFGEIENSVYTSIQVQELIKPYVPSIVFAKAREAVRSGQSEFPPESKMVTVLFADLIDFTASAEWLSSEQLVNMLNIAFNVVVNAIIRNQGSVDKFMGDAVMAIFENARDAVVAGMEIQTHFREVNIMREITNENPINIRVGINTGQVIFGSVGIRERMDWTALGDVVNIASRVESSSESGAVMITDNTYSFVQDLVTIKEKTYMDLKGKSFRVPVMSLASIRFERGKNEVILEI